MISMNIAWSVRKIQYSIIILFLTLASAAMAGDMWGKVLKVINGHTIKIQVRDKEFIVALAGVVCPGADLPSGEAARKFIARQIEGKTVIIRSRGMDPHGRIVGEAMTPGGRNLGEELIRTGRCARLK